MTDGRVSRLQARLTEGYARAHELERTALRLQRESDDLLASGESAKLSVLLSERRRIELELDALRRRLERERGGK